MAKEVHDRDLEAAKTRREEDLAAAINKYKRRITKSEAAYPPIKSSADEQLEVAIAITKRCLIAIDTLPCDCCCTIPKGTSYEEKERTKAREAAKSRADKKLRIATKEIESRYRASIKSLEQQYDGRLEAINSTWALPPSYESLDITANAANNSSSPPPPSYLTATTTAPARPPPYGPAPAPAPAPAPNVEASAPAAPEGMFSK
jgi:hypothetical protein